MQASETAPATSAHANQNRFASLTAACLSKPEKSALIKLALDVLSQRYRPGRSFSSPEDIQGFLRLKLTGRRNEVFGIVYNLRVRRTHPERASRRGCTVSSRPRTDSSQPVAGWWMALERDHFLGKSAASTTINVEPGPVNRP